MEMVGLEKNNLEFKQTKENNMWVWKLALTPIHDHIHSEIRT